MDVAELLATITSAIGFARELKDMDRAFNEAEFKLRIASLTEALADAKVAAVELKEEIDARDSEIKRLKSAFEFQGSTIEEFGWVYEKREDRAVGFPFCPRCLQIDGRHIKLVKVSGSAGACMCPQCKAGFIAVRQYSYPGEW